jgi:hypothetical protein
MRTKVRDASGLFFVVLKGEGSHGRSVKRGGGLQEMRSEAMRLAVVFSSTDDSESGQMAVVGSACLRCGCFRFSVETGEPRESFVTETCEVYS